MNLASCLVLSGVLFAIGAYGLLTRRNFIAALISLELMVNAALINFVAFGRYGGSMRAFAEGGFGVVYRLGIIPMSLFSGAFFPIANLGPVLEWVAMFTPLWHGVNLTRMLVLGNVDPGLAVLHVAVLLVLLVVGWWWAVRRLTARLSD